MCDALRWVALFALLGGCAPALKDLKARETSLSVPDAFDVPGPGGTSAATSTWAAYFDDPALVALIDDAVQHNQELGIQLQETRIANAEALARRGAYLPEVGVGGRLGGERVGEFTSQGASDADHGLPETLGDFSVGFEASWELDLWKRLRNASKAARLRWLSSIEGRNFAVTGVVAEVATSYYELLALDAQLQLVDANLVLLQDSLEAVKLQKEAARETELAVQRFEAELLRNRARRALIQQQVTATENRIHVLCGRFPRPIERDPAAFTRTVGGPVAIGSPQELLENRPDIRAAELAMEAAKLDVKAARAAFYPSLGIEAGVGWESFSLSRLLETPESLAFDVAADLFAPLLNRAELKGRYLAANAAQTQAVLAYERALVTAWAEVATQRANVDNLGQSYDLRTQQVAKLQEAVETSNGLFRNARADYLEVLTTRRDALESQMELIETREQQLRARVDLYRALGGGWRGVAGSTP